ncbi:hypothetical protein B0F90DRAFT_1828361 [Multifurca ochricompacta]|uniref:Uncharacterized protein n=1 Tax=Multifurca ochricompacta TaxID=376703 RepID=A0AAD4MEC7_9AGAM|nr:hypothetical protein B0F90DRAFT_1828361 [Multifurca ochricompacta]
MSAAARAEARRRAILTRGTDRLSKLTTSARGDDAPQFSPAAGMSRGPSTQGDLANFIGEDPHLTPPFAAHQSRHTPDLHTSPFGVVGLDGSPPDPSVWSNEQQQQILQALLGSAPSNRPRTLNANAPDTSGDDPLLAFMSNLGMGADPGKGAGGIPLSQTKVKPKTLTQKLLPLLHLFSVWALVAFFVFWQEPETFRARNSPVVRSGSVWNRWARLATDPTEQTLLWSIQTVPFFWAFISLELAFHSMRIFSGFDSTQPPMLLSLALPHLPKPFPSVIIHGLKYLQLAGTLADDLAAAVVAFGLFIAASNVYENWTLK